jgi:hypothetical protein
MKMAAFDVVTFAVVVMAVGGLVATVWEILAKDPHSVFEMISDSRRFAEAPLEGKTTSADGHVAGIPAAA